MPRIVIGVMGGGENATPQSIEWAKELGALIANKGWVVLSGGRGVGVMDAVGAGAKEVGGLVVGVIPSTDRADASDHVDIAIITGMASARNNINVLSSDVVIACGNTEAGTLSEIALALKANRPVVLLTEDDEAATFLERIGRGRLQRATSPNDAVARVTKLLV